MNKQSSTGFQLVTKPNYGKLLLVSLVYSFLSIHVAWEVLANKKIIATAEARVSFQRIKEWIVIIAAKCSTSYELLGFFKPRIWFELYNEQQQEYYTNVGQKCEDTYNKTCRFTLQKRVHLTKFLMNGQLRN